MHQPCFQDDLNPIVPPGIAQLQKLRFHAARTETGSGYHTGFSLASGLTFGLIAARQSAAADAAWAQPSLLRNARRSGDLLHQRDLLRQHGSEGCAGRQLRKQADGAQPLRHG